MLDPLTLNTLRQFRAGVYDCFGARRDALFELLDAATVAGLVPSLAYLSLAPVHRRGWGSLYDALAAGDIDAPALRELIARYPLDDGQPIYALDTSVWPRDDAGASPAVRLRRRLRSRSARPRAGGTRWAARRCAGTATERPLLLCRSSLTGRVEGWTATAARPEIHLRRRAHLVGTDERAPRAACAVWLGPRPRLGWRACQDPEPSSARQLSEQAHRAGHAGAGGSRAVAAPDAHPEAAMAVVARTRPTRPGCDLAGVRASVRSGTHLPLLQADAQLDYATGADSRAGRSLDLAGHAGLHPASSGAADDRRRAPAVGGSPTS